MLPVISLPGWAKLQPLPLVLVRPDGFVAWMGTPPAEAQMILARVCGHAVDP